MTLDTDRYRCVCGETRNTLTEIDRHRMHCRQYRRHRQNTRLSQFGSDAEP